MRRNDSRNVKGNIPGKQESESKSVISRQNLIEEQSNDKELLDLFKIALTPVEAEKVSVGYLIKDNILMRKWSSHHVTIAPLLLLKEKWLDEDPEKISVLKYVASFKDRLFRAGQMAKRNLQESQSKMKVWYDRKAKSRCFEPLLLLKEKWLDEDPEKISVLKYVASFKDRLFRAGQMAKRNLQESQSKMKVWYDRKAKSRCFEPGDRIFFSML